MLPKDQQRLRIFTWYVHGSYLYYLVKRLMSFMCRGSRASRTGTMAGRKAIPGPTISTRFQRSRFATSPSIASSSKPARIILRISTRSYRQSSENCLVFIWSTYAVESPALSPVPGCSLQVLLQKPVPDGASQLSSSGFARGCGRGRSGSVRRGKTFRASQVDFSLVIGRLRFSFSGLDNCAYNTNTLIVGI